MITVKLSVQLPASYLYASVSLLLYVCVVAMYSIQYTLFEEAYILFVFLPLAVGFHVGASFAE